jgi:hypothetical protein
MGSHTIHAWRLTLARCRQRLLLVVLTGLVSLGLHLVSPSGLSPSRFSTVGPDSDSSRDSGPSRDSGGHPGERNAVYPAIPAVFRFGGGASRAHFDPAD